MRIGGGGIPISGTAPDIAGRKIANLAEAPMLGIAMSRQRAYVLRSMLETAESIRKVGGRLQCFDKLHGHIRAPIRMNRVDRGSNSTAPITALAAGTPSSSGDSIGSKDN